jgi:hypothetical protein
MQVAFTEFQESPTMKSFIPSLITPILLICSSALAVVGPPARTQPRECGDETKAEAAAYACGVTSLGEVHAAALEAVYEYQIHEKGNQDPVIRDFLNRDPMKSTFLATAKVYRDEMARLGCPLPEEKPSEPVDWSALGSANKFKSE